MLHPRRFLLVAILMMVFAGCRSGQNDSRRPLVSLTGRAILPADTILPGPAVGKALDSEINGRSLPLPGIPVQGFSSIIPLGKSQFLVLQDNGFGTMANSPDVPLMIDRFEIHFSTQKGMPDKVRLLESLFISDPHHFLAETPADGSLTGAYLDPESLVRLDDGTFWIGDEFGPALVHLDSLGQVLGPAVDVPLVPELRSFGRGHAILMSPDHPDLRHQAEAGQEANLPRSGGLEGLGRTGDGRFLYASVEKALVEDPDRQRRIILQFDTTEGAFTGRHALYRVDAADVSIASLEMLNDQTLLIMERDSAEGNQARIKRIYRADFHHHLADGTLEKTLVCDLLDIQDRKKLTTAEAGAVGLGADYAFPYITPEGLAVLDDETLLVVNDNNYPLSCGRRPPHTPDDNEFIRLHLEHPLLP